LRALWAYCKASPTPHASGCTIGWLYRRSVRICFPSEDRRTVRGESLRNGKWGAFHKTRGGEMHPAANQPRLARTANRPARENRTQHRESPPPPRICGGLVSSGPVGACLSNLTERHVSSPKCILNFLVACTPPTTHRSTRYPRPKALEKPTEKVLEKPAGKVPRNRQTRYSKNREKTHNRPKGGHP